MNNAEEDILAPELKQAVDSIIQQIDHRDQFARDRMIKVYKRNEYFWEGLQNIYFSEVAHDWRFISDVPDEGYDFIEEEDIEAKVVNIYKAHGEVIISAISQAIPATRFYPNDADQASDIYTAQSFTRLAELIRKHNKSPFLFMKAIGLLYNQGIIAAYTFNDQNSKYGTETVQHFRQGIIKNKVGYCPECGENLAVQPMNTSEVADQLGGAPVEEMPVPEGAETSIENNAFPQEEPPSQPPPAADLMEGMALPPEEPMPPIDPMMEALPEGPMPEVAPPEDLPPPMPPMMEPPPPNAQICPSCGQNVSPLEETEEEPVQELDFEEAIAKSRQIIELYGATNVQIFPRARTLQQSGYLILNDEHDVAEMQEKFPHIADKIVPTADSERYDRWARSPSIVQSDDDSEVCTCRQIWLRPWMFNKIGKMDDERVLALKSQFPSGLRAIYINDVLAEVNDEDMDEYWTVSVDPILDRVHGQPYANPIVPIQEMTNEMFQLTIETVRHGIPETFVDSSVIDLQKYRSMEVSPGALYPVKAPAGGNIGAAFYTNRAALLSREHKEFHDDLQTAGQFVLGTVPSVYGGTMQGGSDTASEYSMSRAQGLQRLQIIYKMISFFWADLESKAVKCYAKNMKTDEKIVKSQGKNSFVNVWIRKAEMTGEVGQVEPELSEQFPLAWAQKRDIIMRLLELNNEALNEALFHPENRHTVAELVGITELTVPGDADRSKQLYEIYELLQGQPQPVGLNPMDGTPVLEASVPVDPEIDDHGVHKAVIKEWCVSEVGMDQKLTNPGGYMNVVAHFQNHTEAEMQEQMKQMMMQGGMPPGGAPPEGPGQPSPPKAKDNESIPAPRGAANVAT
jgi:hypothetical protein